MQCDCEHGGYKDAQVRCSNEATETVITPFGNFQMCTECAEEMRGCLKYMTTDMPKKKGKTVLIVTDTPSAKLQALAEALDALVEIAGEELPADALDDYSYHPPKGSQN